MNKLDIGFKIYNKYTLFTYIYIYIYIYIYFFFLILLSVFIFYDIQFDTRYKKFKNQFTIKFMFHNYKYNL